MSYMFRDNSSLLCCLHSIVEQTNKAVTTMMTEILYMNIYKISDYSPTLLQGIDYNAINKKMEDLRDFSMSFLTNALT